MHRRFNKKKYNKSYAQSGEDLILNTIFNKVKKGTYIDVGACDPFFQSNTYFFYERGWSGINIDANEDSIKKLNHKRKRDKNILAFIHNVEKDIDYYFYQNPAYNGNTYNNNLPSKLIKTKKMKTLTLDKILQLEKFEQINFLSIDTEGNELNVLNSINLKKIRPQAIIIESFNTDIKNEIQTDITRFLLNNEYTLMCKTVTNCIYVSNEFLKERFSFK